MTTQQVESSVEGMGRAMRDPRWSHTVANAALTTISFKYPWVFLPDADGYRPAHGPRGHRQAELFAHDPHWKELVLFYAVSVFMSFLVGLLAMAVLSCPKVTETEVESFAKMGMDDFRAVNLDASEGKLTISRASAQGRL